MRWAPVAAVAVLLAVVPGASGDGARGVSLRVDRHGRLDVVFAPSADRLLHDLRGRSISVQCQRLQAPEEQRFVAPRSAPVPERGRIVATNIRLGRSRPDYCVASRTVTSRNGPATVTTPQTLALRAFTPRGVVLLDLAPVLGAVETVVVDAHEYATQHGGTFPLPAGLAALAPKLVTPFASADDPPPSGIVGYWSDGTTAVARERSPAGRVAEASWQGDVFTVTGADGLDVAPQQVRSLPPKPSDRPHGITASQAPGGTVTFRFPPSAEAAWLHLRGRPVAVSCQVDNPAGGTFGTQATIVGRTLRVQLVEPGAGPFTVLGCTLDPVRRPARRGTVLLIASGAPAYAVVVFNDAGRDVVDTAATARLVESAMSAARALGGQAGTTFATPAALIAYGGGQITALSSPTDTPPPGLVGYWTDGAAHARVAMTTATGRLLFIDRNGDTIAQNTLGAGSVLVPGSQAG
jgi:hypothetical protein